ncbi:hypothetical protein KEM55_005461 [Ascosphaera atra]|nr:hypothetical protein KEM55_005461 [Ascosphaera atra]
MFAFVLSLLASASAVLAAPQGFTTVPAPQSSSATSTSAGFAFPSLNLRDPQFSIPFPTAASGSGTGTGVAAATGTGGLKARNPQLDLPGGIPNLGDLPNLLSAASDLPALSLRAPQAEISGAIDLPGLKARQAETTSAGPAIPTSVSHAPSNA